MPLFLILLFISTNFTLLGSEYTLLSCHNEPYSHIAFIKDKDGNKFVVKQVLQETLKEQFLLIMDCLAAHITQTIGISCNKVTFLKHIRNLQAWITLHCACDVQAPSLLKFNVNHFRSCKSIDHTKPNTCNKL